MTITSSSSAPLIAVTGATGNQGGSVIDHLIASSRQYRVRAITRDASKPSAAAIKKKGAEVVSADLDSPEGAEKAFEGADYVFAVTNFWAHTNKELEIKQGKTLADAAKKVGVKLFIWSGLQDVNKGSNGKLTHVDHFDGKADVDTYARSIGLPTVNVQAACYVQNFEGFLKPQDLPDGKAYLLPTDAKAPVHWIDIENDYGNYVVSALELDDKERPDEVRTVSFIANLDEVVKKLSEATGVEVKYIGAPAKDWEAAVKGSGVPEAIVYELSDMWQWIGQYGYYGGKEASEIKLQHPTQTLDGYFAKSKDAIKKLITA